MTRTLLLRLSAIAFFLAAFTGVSHAGTCTNSLINYGFQQAHLSPTGSGVTGDCAPNIYIGPVTRVGLTTGNAANFVLGSKLCADPWIGEIYLVMNQSSYAQFDKAWCNTALYNGGHWADNEHLVQSILPYAAVHAPTQPSQIPQILDSQIWISTKLELFNTNHQRMAPGTYTLNVTGKNTAPTPNTLHTLRTGTWSTSLVGTTVYVR